MGCQVFRFIFLLASFQRHPPIDANNYLGPHSTCERLGVSICKLSSRMFGKNNVAVIFDKNPVTP